MNQPKRLLAERKIKHLRDSHLRAARDYLAQRAKRYPNEPEWILRDPKPSDFGL